jgi:hypothetical protein
MRCETDHPRPWSVLVTCPDTVGIGAIPGIHTGARTGPREAFTVRYRSGLHGMAAGRIAEWASGRGMYRLLNAVVNERRGARSRRALGRNTVASRLTRLLWFGFAMLVFSSSLGWSCRSSAPGWFRSESQHRIDERDHDVRSRRGSGSGRSVTSGRRASVIEARCGPKATARADVAGTQGVA